MSMGRRKRRQEALFVAMAELAQSTGHPFYRKLNELVAEAKFDRTNRASCYRDQPTVKCNISPSQFAKPARKSSTGVPSPRLDESRST